MIYLVTLIELALCGSILFIHLYIKKTHYIVTSLFFLFYLFVFIIEPLIITIVYNDWPISIVRNSSYKHDDYSVHLLYHIYSIILLSTSFLISIKQLKLPTYYYHPNCDPFKKLKNHKNALALLVTAGFFLFWFSTSTNFFDLLRSSRFSWFENDNFNAGYSAMAGYFIAILPLYLFLFFSSKRKKIDYVFLVITIISILLYGIITKDRKWFFYLLSSFIAYSYIINGDKISITKKKLAMAFIILIIVSLSQVLRDIAPRYFLGEDVEVVDDIHIYISGFFLTSDFSYFYRASIEAIHQNFNNGFNIELGIIRRYLFFFLPKDYSFGLKPEDISATFSDIVDGGDDLRRGNMPPGFWGIFVISFGWQITIIATPLLSIILYKLDSLILKHNIIGLNILTLLFSSIMYFLRGDDSTAIYYPLFGIIVSTLINITTRKK